MTPSDKCYAIIKEIESLRLKAYLDTGKVWTIGFGTTMYPTGKKVQKGDTCTTEEALFFLKYEVILKSKSVNAFTSNVVLNQNQFDALVSFAYNVGIAAFQKSTLLKKVIQNPNDPEINNQFMRWVYDNGKKVKGLINRRAKESELYFTP